MPDGSPGFFHGKEALVLMSRSDPDLEVEYALAYVAYNDEFRKGHVVPLQNQFEAAWVLTPAYPIQPNMSDADLDHWLDLIALRG